MSESMTAPLLEPLGEAKIALQSVNVEAVLEDLLCKVTVQQTYRNLEDVNIEAVYTFPLALNAVLLDLNIKTESRELKGVVAGRAEAEDRYEDAITEGDTAIMLEQVEPGLYTMNVGNLQPEEKIEISITYAELYKWRGDSLRFFLPTTIAPRYGDPESVGVEPHQIPEYDLTADNPFKITITVLGKLADATFESPSHRPAVARQSGRTLISSEKGEALMDRDFVLNVTMEGGEKSFALTDKDIDGHVALASFRPKIPDLTQQTPRCITIIVDCSGSMGGDSIAQARAALHEILGLLKPQDRFNVIRFGSSHRILFPDLVAAGPGNLARARKLLETMDANMGGTEIGGAIAAALKRKGVRGHSEEALLITDGEVWDWDSVTSRAARSGVRFFTVGVGSAVSEPFVQTLAEVTGGACELVSPQENMSEKIVRHFRRIYASRAQSVTIDWPSEPDKVFPEKVDSVYDGDTLHYFGWFKDRPEGEVTLKATLENGEVIAQSLPIRGTSEPETGDSPAGTMARMAAAQELRSLTNPKDAVSLAEKYQLMSRYTNYIAVDVREDGQKAVDLPALRKTPQMLAAGWGGHGGLVLKRVLHPDNVFGVRASRGRYALACESPPMDNTIGGFIDAMNHLHSSFSASSLEISTIRELESLGVPEDVTEALRALINSGIEDDLIVVVFLYRLSQQKRFKAQMHRPLRRIITKAFKQLDEVPDPLVEEIDRIITTNASW